MRPLEKGTLSGVRRLSSLRRLVVGAFILPILFVAACGSGNGGTSPGGDSANERSRGGEGSITLGDPAKLPGDPVPVEFLPEGFVLPKEAIVIQGGGDYKPANGQFYLQLDAPLNEVRGFFQRQYPKNGWEEISVSTFNQNGSKGFELLYGKNDSQLSAGFTGKERDGKVLVKAYYNNQSKA